MRKNNVEILELVKEKRKLLRTIDNIRKKVIGHLIRHRNFIRNMERWKKRELEVDLRSCRINRLKGLLRIEKDSGYSIDESPAPKFRRKRRCILFKRSFISSKSMTWFSVLKIRIYIYINKAYYTFHY